MPLFALLVAAVLSAVLAATAGATSTKRIDVDARGRGMGAGGGAAGFAADGRYIVFGSGSVWMRDRRRGTLRRIDRTYRDRLVSGDYASVSSFDISPDGRYLAFTSAGDDIVRGDTNRTCFDEFEGGPKTCHSASDVFVRDLRRGTTRRVSLSSDEQQADADSYGVQISAGGRYLVFGSAAANLVAGDTNRAEDVFVRDRRRGTTERISVGPGGAQSNGYSGVGDISPDGRYVLIGSGADNLVAGDVNGNGDTFVRDRRTGVNTLATVGDRAQQGDADSGFASMSNDGTRVVFRSPATNLVPGDTNAAIDIFVRDLRARTTSRVSIGSRGEAPGPPDAFNGESLYPTISNDGRYAAYASFAENLVPGDTNDHLDVFVHEIDRRVTRRVSLTTRGRQANSASASPALSEHGSYVLFESYATNLGGGPAPRGSNSGLYMRGRLHR